MLFHEAPHKLRSTLEDMRGAFGAHMTFRQISEFLPSHFIQIHRSYIANMKHVITAERTQVTLDEGTRLPVSETRRSFLLQYMNKHSNLPV